MPGNVRPLMMRSHGADFKKQPETLQKNKTKQQQPNRKFLQESSERKPTDFPLCAQPWWEVMEKQPGELQDGFSTWEIQFDCGLMQRN